MKKNVGNTERMIRFLTALAIIIFYFTHIFTGTVGIVLLAVAGLLAATALAGFCPLYLLSRKPTDVQK